MLYIYDNAIVDDLIRSFNPENIENPAVRVISPEQITGVAAQLQDDTLSFPIVAVTRDIDSPVDTQRSNFTRMKKGVSAVLDTETNDLYYERAIPIEIGYSLTLLTTSTADMDELVRELMFKYMSQYFLTVQVPYESKRQIRFGVTVDFENLEKSSGSSEYAESGQLYQTVLRLKCEGCVMIHYTPAKLRNTDYSADIYYNNS